MVRCMSTSVSVMKAGNIVRRFFREKFFRTSTSRYVRSHVSLILLCIYHAYGFRNKWIVYTLTASPKEESFKTQNILVCLIEVLL